LAFCTRETVILLRRAAYSVIDVALFNSALERCYAFLLLSALLLLLHVFLQPFNSYLENLLEGAGISLLVILSATLMLTADKPLDQNSPLDAWITTLIVLPTGVMLFFVIYRLFIKHGQRGRAVSMSTPPARTSKTMEEDSSVQMTQA
jgi:hypothetical protein